MRNLTAIDLIGLAAFSFGIGFCVGAAFQHSMTIDICRQEAIKHDAAEYVCDEKTGETTFQWKEQRK